MQHTAVYERPPWVPHRCWGRNAPAGSPDHGLALDCLRGASRLPRGKTCPPDPARRPGGLPQEGARPSQTW